MKHYTKKPGKVIEINRAQSQDQPGVDQGTVEETLNEMLEAKGD